MVWDAIALHSTVGIPPRKSAEAALVRIGAGTDLFGFGVELLEMSDIQRVFAEFPRYGFARKFPELLADFGRRKARQHAFRFVAEVAREHVQGFPGPTYKALFAHWASVVEPGS